MDKLTAIKIKYDDGTYSDEIPVSVLSENVEWDSTHTLVDILGSIDVDVTGTIQDQINQLFNEKVNSSEINFVTPEMFGAVGDGVHDDTIALKNTFKFANENDLKVISCGKPVQSNTKTKVYGVSEPIDINMNTCLDFGGATIKALKNIDQILKINCSFRGGYITNIRLDCNNLADKGIHVVWGWDCIVDKLWIDHVKQYGVYIQKGAIRLSNFNIESDKECADETYGIYNELGTDSKITNGIIINCKYGVWCNAGGALIFENIHVWSANINHSKGSIAFYHNGATNFYTNCVSDTMLIGFYSRNKSRMLLCNCLYELNSVAMNDETLDGTIPYVIYSPSVKFLEAFTINCLAINNDNLSVHTHFSNFTGYECSEYIGYGLIDEISTSDNTTVQELPDKYYITELTSLNTDKFNFITNKVYRDSSSIHIKLTAEFIDKSHFQLNSKVKIGALPYREAPHGFYPHDTGYYYFPLILQGNNTSNVCKYSLTLMIVNQANDRSIYLIANDLALDNEKLKYFDVNITLPRR